MFRDTRTHPPTPACTHMSHMLAQAARRWTSTPRTPAPSAAAGRSGRRPSPARGRGGRSRRAGGTTAAAGGPLGRPGSGVPSGFDARGGVHPIYVKTSWKKKQRKVKTQHKQTGEGNNRARSCDKHANLNIPTVAPWTHRESRGGKYGSTPDQNLESPHPKFGPKFWHILNLSPSKIYT